MNRTLLTVGRLLTFVTLLSLPPTATAQKDSIYLDVEKGQRNSLIRGRITSTSAFQVTIETDGESKKVPVKTIRKLSFEGEPRNIDRARDHYENERFDDALASLGRVDEEPDSSFVKQEQQFLTAAASGRIALRGDPAVSLEAGEQLLDQFIRSNSSSYRLVEAVDLYGQVLLAAGKLDKARQQFGKLTKSRWPHYVNRGHFYEGETQLLLDNPTAAKSSFSQLLGGSADDPQAQQFKLLAECQLARITALEGDHAAAIATLEKIIKQQNVDDTRLFATAYNALGYSHLAAGDSKAACRAFLHTELLFSAQPDAHAEALFNLVGIWSQLKKADRSSRARQLLTTRYRNTIWAGKL